MEHESLCLMAQSTLPSLVFHSAIAIHLIIPLLARHMSVVPRSADDGRCAGHLANRLPLDSR